MDFGDFGFWILDLGDFGFWILDLGDFGDFGFWILGILDFGFWILGILDFGFWRFLEFGGLGILDWQVVTKFWMLHKKRRLCTPTRVGGFVGRWNSILVKLIGMVETYCNEWDSLLDQPPVQDLSIHIQHVLRFKVCLFLQVVDLVGSVGSWRRAAIRNRQL